MFLSRDLSSWKPGRHFSFGWTFIKRSSKPGPSLKESWVSSDRIQTDSTFGQPVYLVCRGEICWDRRKRWSHKLFFAAWVFPENNTLIDIFWYEQQSVNSKWLSLVYNTISKHPCTFFDNSQFCINFWTHNLFWQIACLLVCVWLEKMQLNLYLIQTRCTLSIFCCIHPPSPPQKNLPLKQIKSSTTKESSKHCWTNLFSCDTTLSK